MTTNLRSSEPDFIFDADSHLSEPPDVWTARLPAKWLDAAPKVIADPKSSTPKWHIGSHLVNARDFSHAGWKEFYPSTPPTLKDADPACWDAKSRLDRLDEYGIVQQVLYPNLLGFHYYAFSDYEPDLRLACFQAYNDFQTEFCEADPTRLIPIMNLPFWDVDLSIAEMERCVELGHKGVNFGWQFEKLGLPRIRDPHWDPLLSRVQELELPMSFHIGCNSMSAEAMQGLLTPPLSTDLVQNVALLFLTNAGCISELIMSGLCERYPRLNFISVESGFGFVPFLLQALDWQFMNTTARAEHSKWLLPSEYFKRQVYATIWFERGIERQIDLYPHNVMFSSDFPHPTSLSPGDGTTAMSARDTSRANLAEIDPDVRAAVLCGTARQLYHLTD